MERLSASLTHSLIEHPVREKCPARLPKTQLAYNLPTYLSNCKDNTTTSSSNLNDDVVVSIFVYIKKDPTETGFYLFNLNVLKDDFIFAIAVKVSDL